MPQNEMQDVVMGDFRQKIDARMAKRSPGQGNKPPGRPRGRGRHWGTAGTGETGSAAPAPAAAAPPAAASGPRAGRDNERRCVFRRTNPNIHTEVSDPNEPEGTAKLTASIEAFKNRKRYNTLDPIVLESISDSEVDARQVDYFA